MKDDQRNIARPPSRAHTTTRFAMGYLPGGGYGPTSRGVNGSSGSAASLPKVIYRHRPAGKGGLRLRPLAATVHPRLSGLLRGVDAYPLLSKDVHVPHHARPP